MKFNELNLTSDLMRGIEEADFTECTPVQEQTFKLVLDEGRDAIVQSQTGTGKTAAFLISIFDIFERQRAENGNRHAALVVVPTRELAVQVADEAKVLGKHLPYQIGSVFGGVGYGPQERLIERGADIIIGTPG
ncbi:MAG TPA: DEAD/DEAH box helicase, partial [Spirochaetia bacterium]|nr:DEAD/DEAH box helicase [Spirochaetia bacterium]